MEKASNHFETAGRSDRRIKTHRTLDMIQEPQGPLWREGTLEGNAPSPRSPTSFEEREPYAPLEAADIIWGR